MSQPTIDLTSELLRGMRLSGVNYRRIETSRPFGVGFSAVAGKAQFHFISRGPVLLRMASGEQFTLESGDALFIPNGDGHALLSDPQAAVVNVAQLNSETVCSTVSCINAGGQPDCPERAVIFSGCMDFELGGMQPLVKAMPEVMRVSCLLNTWPEIQPLLAAMERESLTRQAGYAGILARLADVVAALIVRGWVACGCGNATGWVQVLCDPRLAKAIYAMHQRPGVNWKVEDLAREAGLSRSLFAERFLAATGTTPARYLTELRMRLAVSPIVDGQRHDPQGNVIRWRIFTIDGDTDGLVYPFVLQWGEDDETRLARLRAQGLDVPHPLGDIVLEQAVFEVDNPQAVRDRWQALLGFPSQGEQGLDAGGQWFIFRQGPANQLAELVFRVANPALKGQRFRVGNGVYRFI